jgi:CRP-like cAMP-binding protein
MTFHIFDQQDSESFAAGQVIFETGTVGEIMFAVQQGEVNIWRDGKLLETVTAGSIFGEMALIDSQPRSATAIAKTDCKLVVVDKKRFNFLVQQNPFFALNVMQILTHRLRRGLEL